MADLVPLSELADYFSILRRYSKELRGKRSVHTLDVGYVWKSGKMTDKIGIRAHVLLKRPLEVIDAADLLPTEVDGCRVDVLQSKRPRNADEIPAEYTTLRDPIQGGMAVFNTKTPGPGTLGAIVYDTMNGGGILGLSCLHVFIGSGSVTNPANLLIQHPPLGEQRGVIGSALGGRNRPELDAALMTIAAGKATSWNLLGNLGPLNGTAEPALSLELTKVGAKTGVTRGMIDGISELQFTLVRVAGDTSVGEISRPGDSGAIWFDAGARAVGLHFRGEDPDEPVERAWAKRAPIVAERLYVAFSPP
jgi:hypothetical protein